MANPQSLYGNYGAVPILTARAKYRRRRDRFESNLTDVEWTCLIPMYSPATSQIPESGPLNSFRTGSQGGKLYRVSLSASERRELQAIVDGTGAAWRRRRAQILRMADEGRDGGKLTVIPR